MEHNLTFKQQFRNIRRGLALLAGLRQPMLLSSALSILIQSPRPFINLWFSARILNELVGARDIDRLIFLVVLFISINLFMGILCGAFNRWNIYCKSQNRPLMYNMLTRKMLEADYTDLENPDFQLEHTTIQEHQNGMGFGLPHLFDCYNGIIEGLFRVGLSIGFAFSLFKLPVPEQSSFVWLDAPWAVAIMLFLLTLSIFISPYLYARGSKVWAKASEVNNRHNRFEVFYLWTMIGFNERAKDIRIYDQRRMIDKTADETLLDFSIWKPFLKYAAKHYVTGNVIYNISSGFVYLYAALKAFAGAFGVGSIVQYVGAINQFADGFSMLVGRIGQLYSNSPFLDRFLNFIDKPQKKSEGNLPVKNLEGNRYEIEFHNVSFKYPGSDKYALKSLNLKFNVGQRFAVVGMNGSGKTTMIKLLCRLYDPTEGKITLNGIDIKKYNYNDYLGIFGVVFQDYTLLCFTLGENVAANADYDADRVKAALDKTGFTDRLETMTLDTYLYKWFDEKGVEISGGEAQKIALARALYKDASFIVLDEPTAALDPVAEYDIYKRFNEMVQGKTAIYISHRLSSCRFCDNIIVFHEGELVQQGSHEELMNHTDGKYFALWNAQAQYYA